MIPQFSMSPNLATKLRLSRLILPSDQKPHGSGGRQAGIDLVRALGVLAVVLYHYSYRFPAAYLYGGKHVDVFAYGKLGVNMFFIVSAFCISGSLDRSRSLVQFIAKRVARLYPAYVICALSAFIIIMFFGLPEREVSFSTLILNLLWINMALPVRHVDGAYWTIAFELRFYFLIGAAYFLANRDYGKVMAFWRILNIAGIILYASSFILKDSTTGSILRIVNANLFLHPFGVYFLLGVTLFRWGDLTFNYRTINVSLFFMGVVFSDYSLDEKLVCIAFFPATWILLRAKQIRVPAPLLWIGLISYPLYLLHQNIGLVIIRETWPTVNLFYLRALIAFALVTAAAALINFRLEPLMRRPFERALITLGSAATRRLTGQKKDDSSSVT